MKVKTEEVSLNSFSLVKDGYCLPTFQKARLKTVYWWGIPIRRYLFFTYIRATKLKVDGTNIEYLQTYIKVKK